VTDAGNGTSTPGEFAVSGIGIPVGVSRCDTPPINLRAMKEWTMDVINKEPLLLYVMIRYRYEGSDRLIAGGGMISARVPNAQSTPPPF
jgi:hypothetical protein